MKVGALVYPGAEPVALACLPYALSNTFSLDKKTARTADRDSSRYANGEELLYSPVCAVFAAVSRIT